MPPGPKAKPPELRFWEMVSLPDEKGCLRWLGYVGPTGYGGFNAGEAHGGMTTAHRFSYVLSYGAVPDGLQVDHLCRVRDCVAPLHLQAVSQTENVRRGDAGRWRPDECTHGHPFTPENTWTRSNGHRSCRECGRRRAREYQRRRREQQGASPQR